MPTTTIELPIELLDRKFGVCAQVLVEAGRLVSAQVYGSILTHMLGRAGELLEEIEEILCLVDADTQREVFGKANDLRRRFNELSTLAARDRRTAGAKP